MFCVGRINIISSDPTWIYGKFIKEFTTHSSHIITLNSKDKCDIVHWLPYYEYCPTSVQSTSWQSHQEQREPLRSKFVFCAKNVDFAICQAKKYVDFLKLNDIKNVCQIMPGINLDIYNLRKIKSSKKLTIGWVGRSYTSTNRKNEQLLKEISKLSFVDLKITGGKIKEEDMPKFYHQCDLVVSCSTIEGGPMCITESLACGIPVLCFENVGVANEFEHGIIKVPFAKNDLFVAKLKDFWYNKEYERFSDKDVMQKMRNQVSSFTWKSFVSNHEKIWESLMNKNQ